MQSKIPSPRNEIRQFAPYVPGMPIEEVKERYNISEVIKLASNENLWGFSKSVKKSIEAEIQNINIYPQPTPKAILDLIAEKNNVKADNIILGNGTDELIMLIALTYLSNSDSVVISENSFIRYKMAGDLMGSTIIEVPMSDLKIDIDNIISAVNESVKAVYIDNPCNPTGTCIDFNEIKKLVSAVSDLDSPPLIIIDEAYYEYVQKEEYGTAIQLVKENKNIVVLRTFSKAYGLAGLRMGFCVASSEVIKDMNRIRPPFNTNRLAQAAVAGALLDESFINDVIEKTQTEKEYLYIEFGKLGIDFIPSQTNFILIKLEKTDINMLCEVMLKNGIVLRPLAGYNLNGFLRITVGPREFNEKMLKLLDRFLEDEREVEK